MPARAVVFDGTAVGSWVNPAGTFGFSITNADAGGTADIEWGVPVPGSFTNLFTFDGVGSDGGPGWSTPDETAFKIGDFRGKARFSRTVMCG